MGVLALQSMEESTELLKPRGIDKAVLRACCAYGVPNSTL